MCCLEICLPVPAIDCSMPVQPSLARPTQHLQVDALPKHLKSSLKNKFKLSRSLSWELGAVCRCLGLFRPVRSRKRKNPSKALISAIGNVDSDRVGICLCLFCLWDPGWFGIFDFIFEASRPSERQGPCFVACFCLFVTGCCLQVEGPETSDLLFGSTFGSCIF